ncbi:hypothetical protein [Kurthia sibirica]|uniref:hypothetical protein n=1 Tax=Kurthia sibirica TaxID=202750 RepID=UPI0011B286DB|nr:hypothetical protein [Kurthia sibirica]
MFEDLKIASTVPTSVQNELKKFASDGNGAVVEVTDGYTVLVLNHAELEKIQMHENGTDDFGQFSSDLRGDGIRSATRFEDLNEGRVILVPTNETIEKLMEYNSFNEAVFNWGIYPSESENLEELHTEIKGQTIKLGVLFNSLKNDDFRDKITDDYLNGNAEMTRHHSAVDTQNVATENEVVDDESDELHEFDEEETDDTDSMPSWAMVDSVIPNDSSADDDDEISAELEKEEDISYLDESPLNFDDDDETLFDGNNDDDETYDESPLSFDDNELEIIDEDEETEGFKGQEKALREVVPAEDFKQEIFELTERKVEDPEIAYVVETEDFNRSFARRNPFYFELTDNENGSLLNSVLNEKRKQYNNELARLHEEHIQNITHVFTMRMDGAVGSVREILNIDDTVEGAVNNITLEYQRIIEDYTNKLNSIDDLNKEKTKEMTLAYNQKREEFAEQMKQKAYLDYNQMHQQSFEKEKGMIRDSYVSQFIRERAEKLKEFNMNRQLIANRFLSEANREVLSELQGLYQKMMRQESETRNKMEKELSNYMKKHFTDDVLRTEAIAEKARQDDEAARVRKEMEAQIIANQNYVKDMQVKADANVEVLQRDHRLLIEKLQSDFTRELDAKNKLINERETALRDKEEEVKRRYNEQREDNQSLLDEAKFQYEDKLKVLRDSLESQKQVIDTYKSKSDKRLTNVLIGSAALVTTLIIVFLVLFTNQYSKDNSNANAVTKSEVTLKSDSPLLNSEAAASKDSDENGNIDAYIATAKDKNNASLIIEYKESYKTGDKVKAIGSIDGGTVNETLKVKSVEDDVVTVASSDGDTYTFTVTE